MGRECLSSNLYFSADATIVDVNKIYVNKYLVQNVRYEDHIPSYLRSIDLRMFQTADFIFSSNNFLPNNPILCFKIDNVGCKFVKIHMLDFLIHKKYYVEAQKFLTRSDIDIFTKYTLNGKELISRIFNSSSSKLINQLFATEFYADNLVNIEKVVDFALSNRNNEARVVASMLFYARSAREHGRYCVDEIVLSKCIELVDLEDNVDVMNGVLCYMHLSNHKGAKSDWIRNWVKSNQLLSNIRGNESECLIEFYIQIGADCNAKYFYDSYGNQVEEDFYKPLFVFAADNAYCTLANLIAKNNDFNVNDTFWIECENSEHPMLVSIFTYCLHKKYFYFAKVILEKAHNLQLDHYDKVHHQDKLLDIDYTLDLLIKSNNTELLELLIKNFSYCKTWLTQNIDYEIALMYPEMLIILIKHNFVNVNSELMYCDYEYNDNKQYMIYRAIIENHKKLFEAIVQNKNFKFVLWNKDRKVADLTSKFKEYDGGDILEFLKKKEIVNEILFYYANKGDYETLEFIFNNSKNTNIFREIIIENERLHEEINVICGEEIVGSIMEYEDNIEALGENAQETNNL